MKYTFIACISIAVMTTASSCKENARYIDPNTGQPLSLVKDASTGLMVDETTKKPVYIYVDTETNDTIYGSTGKVINGQIVLEEGNYKYKDYKMSVEDGEYKVKSGDYKMEVEKDGDITVKDGDKKTKIEGETGEVKTKED